MTNARYRKRILIDRFATALTYLCAAIGIGLLALILGKIIVEGFQALSADLFLRTTPAPGSRGGLANAIVGSLMISGLAMLGAIPFGVMGGVYLAEYARGKKLASSIRFLNDILLSAPSICFGLLVYEILVVPFHGFSGFAGALALTFIAIPVILRTTEAMLTLVPDALREAAAALGAPTHHIVLTICFRAARQGIITGILLAFARIAGETAPLLFTALNNQFWNVKMTGPTANLPVTIYELALSPYADWQSLAWGGALLITLTVLIVNLLARFGAKDLNA